MSVIINWRFCLFLYLILIFSMIGIFYKLKKMNTPQKKNLILGVIKNYSWETIKPFFISLIKANFKSCDYVLFVLGLSNETIENIQNYGVKTIEIPEKYRKMKINNVRYKLYEEYLNNNTNKYNIILHLDVRDTIFQKDLFEIYKNNKKSFIGVSLEDGVITEKKNSEWMENQYGNDIYNILKNETIICSGTIWGTADKFLELVRKIWEEIKLKSPYEESILDQTATNYIIYYKKMFNDSLIKSDINIGPVMTVGLARNKDLKFDSEGNVLTFNGELPAVIHQYDRVPKIVEIVKNKFNSLVNTSNITINNSYEIKKKGFEFYILIIFVSLVIIIIINISLIFLGFIKINFSKNKEEKLSFKKVSIIKQGSRKNKIKFHKYRKINNFL